METIRQRETVRVTERRRDFKWKDEPGGFSFDADEDGHIIVTQNNQHNAITALLGSAMGCIEDEGLQVYEWSYVNPRIGKCDACGKEVHLEHFTNTCECGADYNSSGQRLAPRSQWGEETGESLGDILRIP